MRPIELCAVSAALTFSAGCTDDGGATTGGSTGMTASNTSSSTSSSSASASSGSGGMGTGGMGPGGAGAGGMGTGGMGAGGAGGTTPTGCDWDISSLSFPIVLHPGPYFYGGIAFDANCDLLVAGGFEDQLYRVGRTTGAVTTAASGFPNGSEVHGVVHRQTDGEIYVSASAVDLTPSLYRVSAGTAVLVFDLPARLTDIAVVPAGFGAFAGLIAGSGADGKVYIVDPAVPSATPIGMTTGPIADLAFAPDGSVVYIAKTDANAIEAMTAAGVFSPVAAGLSAIDGLAIHPAGHLLYAAHWMGNSVLSTVSLPDGTVTFYATAQVDLGYSTTGLVVDAGGNLLMKSWVASQAVLLAP